MCFFFQAEDGIRVRVRSRGRGDVYKRQAVYSLTGGGPGTATEVYSLYTYRTGMKFFDLGYASALGYLLLAIVIVVINFFFRQMREVYE